MNFSFYSSAVGAQAMQNKLDVASNNLSNLNTTGYKAKNGYFTDLIYKNIKNVEGDNGNVTYGAGTRLKKVDTNFEQGSFTLTDMPLDYAINGDGFFALYDPAEQVRTYTRDGSFQLSLQQNGQFYITNSDGKWVLDQNGNPIVANDVEAEHPIGVFVFQQKNGMVSVGNNEFMAIDKNGTPIASNGNDGLLVRGAIEDSNVDFTKEIADMLQIQNVYQMSLKMVQTTDEIENTVNSLR